MDGGSVCHNKWLAIGYLFKTKNGLKFNILDVKVFERCKAIDIQLYASSVQKKMKEKSNAKDIATCTDNVANFKKAFFDMSEDDDEFVPLNMIRVCCSRRTIQLALKNLKNEDKFYRSLIQKMKLIPSKISLLTRKQLKQYEILFFPPI